TPKAAASTPTAAPAPSSTDGVARSATRRPRRDHHHRTSRRRPHPRRLPRVPHPRRRPPHAPHRTHGPRRHDRTVAPLHPRMQPLRPRRPHRNHPRQPRRADPLMANPQKNKGDKAELEAARLLADLTGWPVRRKLGAGRADDTGDLDNVPDTTVQVKDYTDVLRA